MTERLYDTSPLIQGKKTVRLLRLLEGASDSTICCHLETFELDDAPSYVALSYTWGSESSPRRMIKVNEFTFHARQNLWIFLDLTRRFTPDGEVNWLWIDAICINQNSNLEKGHQLPLMGRIYEQADSVEVWLGEEQDGSEDAMRFLEKRVHKPIRLKGTTHIPPWSKSTAKALVALCNRDYWRRMWIVQETHFAKCIHVLCGRGRVLWSAFEALHRTLTLFKNGLRFEHCLEEGRMLTSPCMDLVASREGWPKDASHTEGPCNRTLKCLLYKYKGFACSDPRDRVFALLGLADPPPRAFPHTYASNAHDIHIAVMDEAYGGREDWISYVNAYPHQASVKPQYQDIFKFSRDVADMLRIVDPMEPTKKGNPFNNSARGRTYDQSLCSSHAREPQAIVNGPEEAWYAGDGGDDEDTSSLHGDNGEEFAFEFASRKGSNSPSPLAENADNADDADNADNGYDADTGWMSDELWRELEAEILPKILKPQKRLLPEW